MSNGSCGRVSDGGRLLGALLLSAGVLVAVPPALWAADLQVAQADSVHAFEIPAQPLPQALIRFSQASGIELFFDAQIAEGGRSAPLSGSFTVRDGLIRLLAGTGLTFRFTNATTVTLERLPLSREGAASGGAIMLDPVSVEASRARAPTSYGPVEGFVAPLSAGGTKTDTPLVETPQSISVVTGDEIETRNARSFADALGYTSGVRAGTMGASNGFGGDSTSIRGFGGNGTSGPSSNEYIDGLRLGGTGYLSSALDPYMFERAEVIKGPASVLYGQSTPGGLVNMVSKRPTFEPLHEVHVQTGNLGRAQIGFDLSDPIDPAGKFSYRLTGIAYRTDTETDHSDDKRRVTIAPSFTWRPNDQTTLTLLTRYQNDDFGGSALNWLPSVGTVLPNPNGTVSRSLFTGDPNYERWKRESVNLGYALEHRFDDTWTARQNFRFVHNKLDYAGLYISNMFTDRLANRQAFGMIEHSNDYTLDNQLQAKLVTGPVRHTVIGGVDGQWFASDTDRVLDRNAPRLDVFNPVYGVNLALQPYQKNKTDGRQYGLYLQDQIAYDRWRIVLGLRGDWARSESTDQMIGVTTAQKDDALTKRGALMYVFDNGLSPYVSYTESFEPTIGTILANGSTAKPTEGVQYEAGVKYQPTGFNSFVTASVFDLRRKNVVTRDPVVPTLSVQTGEIASRGLELEAKASLASGLNATVAYTFLDAEVTESNTISAGVPVKGKTPTRIPKHSASLWVDYTFQNGPMRGFGIGAGTRYVGESYGDDPNTFKVPSFTLVDAMMRYDLANVAPQLQGVQLQLNASNLFDKEYVSACSGTNRCYYGSGRMVFATVKYKW